MPFTKLMPPTISKNHHCKLPINRENGARLEIGDEWVCDVLVVTTGFRDHVCGKKYRWSYNRNSGYYWLAIVNDNV